MVQLPMHFVSSDFKPFDLINNIKHSGLMFQFTEVMNLRKGA